MTYSSSDFHTDVFSAAQEAGVVYDNRTDEESLDDVAGDAEIAITTIERLAKERKALVQVAERLLSWEASMGGFEAQVWTDLRNILQDTREDRAAGAPTNVVPDIPLLKPHDIDFGNFSPSIVIMVEGGLVHGAHSNMPSMQGLQILVVDADTEGGDPDRIHMVTEFHGNPGPGVYESYSAYITPLEVEETGQGFKIDRMSSAEMAQHEDRETAGDA